MAIYLDGISCENYGIVVESYPKRIIPEKQYEILSVPGRNGDLIFDQNAYKNYTQTYSVFLKAESANLSVEGAVQRLNEWLFPALSGYATLRDDYDPNTYRLAYFSGGLDVSNIMNTQGRVDLEFYCKPQRFRYNKGTVSATATGKAASAIVQAPTGFSLMPARPYIEAIANGVTMVLTERRSTTDIARITIPKTAIQSNSIYRVVVDCQNYIIYGLTLSGKKVNISESVQIDNDFFEIPSGGDPIYFINGTASDESFSSGAQVSISVTPNWWRL